MGNTGSLHEMNANCQGDLASYNRNSRFRAGINHGGVSIKKHQLESSCLSSPILSYEREINSDLGEWAKSFPRTKTATANEMPLPHLKVLPHLNESLKLRITANGTILHSGGTISGRREQAESNCLQPPMLMQRSRTLIFEHSGAKQQNAAFNTTQTGASALRRAQTQFQLNYKNKHQQQEIFAAAQNNNEAQSLTAAAARTSTRSEPDLRTDAATAGHTAEAIGTAAAINKCNKNAKANKYNKKRKAPAAPNIITANVASNAKANFVAPNISRQQSASVEQTSSTTSVAATTTAEFALALGKSRIFLTKAETDSNIAGQRNFLAQKKPVIPTVVQQLPYRREKSFDATLLYERTPQSIVAEIEQQQHVVTPTTLQQQHVVQKDKRGDTKIPQLKQKFYFGMDTQRTAAATFKETANKVTVPFKNDTKLPAIIMHKRAKQQAPINKRIAEQATSSSSASIIMTTAVYDINVSPKQYEDDNDNNGLQVHVRPMLPRRQLDIPRFSPAAAWRMLTEKQQSLQLQRQSMKLQASTVSTTAAAKQHSNMTTVNNEEPIQPVCKALKKFVVSAAAIDTRVPKKFATKVSATPWTPQQDLEDDDDDDSSSDGFRAKTNANDTNSLFLVDSSLNIAATGTPGRDSSKSRNGNGAASVHIFSLSLPRDGHFGTGFCDNKPINEKKSGFSSLQKIKRTVSGGNCGCIQTKYSDQVIEKILGTGADQFKTNYDDVILSTSSGMQQENTLDNNVQDTGYSNGYRSDNWVLSKTKFCVIGERDNFQTATAKINFSPNMNTNKSSQRWNTLVSREPVSLSYLTAGKHVMYLPGHNNLTDHSNLNKITAMEHDSTKCKTVDVRQNQKTKSRKRELHIRQSLQDPIPLEISNSGSKHTTMRDLPGERNSLQNEKQQRFSFQSTVRLIEKRRLAEKLSKDAEIKEAQRRSELEAMKRVEEDFQRKRASEKATIRQQLRLVSNLDSFDQQLNQFQSLPANSDELPMKNKHFYDLNMNQLERLKYNNEDANYNIYYRADPEGAVSSPSNSPVLQYANDSENPTFNFNPFDFNGTTAPHLQHQDRNSNINIEGEILESQRTASFVEPYLQSIVK